MTYVVLIILAVVWAVYLASWLRSRSQDRGVDSISSFSRHLSVLERTTPGRSTRSAARSRGTSPVPGSPVVRRLVVSPIRKRRQDVLTGLLAGTAFTAGGALFIGSFFRPLLLLTAVLTVTYVVLLARVQRRLVEQRAKVRYLGAHPARSTARPAAPTAAQRAQPARRTHGGVVVGGAEWRQVEAPAAYTAGAHAAERFAEADAAVERYAAAAGS